MPSNAISTTASDGLDDPAVRPSCARATSPSARQELVGHALECLAEHDEAAGPVARSRCRLDSQPCRRPWPHSAASTTRSSVCTGLTLSQPVRVDPPRRALQRLDDDALVAAGDASAGTPRASAVAGDDARHPRPAAGHGSIAAAARLTGRSSRSRRRRAGRRRSTPSAVPSPARRCVPRSRRARGLLERSRAAVGPQRDGLAVQDHRAQRQRTYGLDDLGHPLAISSRVRVKISDLVAVAMHLDPDAVQLPLDGRRARAVRARPRATVRSWRASAARAGPTSSWNALSRPRRRRAPPRRRPAVARAASRPAAQQRPSTPAATATAS